MRRMAQDLRVLLATDRSGVHALFERVAELHPTRMDVTRLDVASQAPDLPETAQTVAVIDVAVDRVSAQRLARRLNDEHPSLPMIALVCCEHAANLPQLSALAAAGVNGLIDLHATPEETLAALQGAAQGDIVIRLGLSESYKRLWRTMVGSEGYAGETDGKLSEVELDLLDFLTRGLGDREMGQELNLSPHTVKHRIEQLRQKVGMPNRIALAAWAGKHLSSPRTVEAEPEPDMEYVR
jgi:DNA-binding NarL/FixJ family response regulator